MPVEEDNAYQWVPTPELIASTRQTEFLRRNGLRTFEDMAEWSERDPSAFWDAVIRYGDLQFYEPYHTVMDVSGGIEWARWCLGGKTNMVLNCIDRHRNTPIHDKTFLIWVSETGDERTYTYRQFDELVCRFASVLKSLGVGIGDVVALYMPLVPEALVGYFATVKLGAVVMPLFSGFGAGAVSERLTLSGAKVLLTSDGTLRRGKPVAMKAIADEAVGDLPISIVTVDRLGLPCGFRDGRDHRWQDLVDAGDPSWPTQPMVADSPAVLHYTSGTTGRPKGGIYTHIGLVTKMVLDHGILTDFRETDRHFCMADMGWMVGSKLATLPSVHGGSLVIAEGTPDYPNVDRYWQIIERYKVTNVELAPALIRLLMTYGDQEVTKHDLSSLRIVLTGGESWTERPWRWLFEVVGKKRVPILNSAGGTEVSGSILNCDLHHPLKIGSFSIAIPGMGADVVDLEGNKVPPGVFGELIMRQPSIGLIKGLWNEPERYIDNYWQKIPGVWVHGDFASRDADGDWFLHGRSDDTLKVSGKRVGPSEIENAIMNTGQFRECAVIGQPSESKGTAIIAVCVPFKQGSDTRELERLASDAVARELGKSFKPERVLIAADLPKTRNMKIMRRAVRAAVNGDPTGDTSSLTNPEAIEAIRALAHG
ncbi:AMP-binding protein [Pseudochelatococcus sp. B33]